jgi:hypothetical protein
MVAVFLPGAIATCAPGRASVNCPNKKDMEEDVSERDRGPGAG